LSILLLIYAVTMYLARRSASLRTGLIAGGTLALLVIVTGIALLNSPDNTPVANLGKAIVFGLFVAFA
jgi:4-amino-4-deoxy-L-arabinose transferase-like glycosyltransferase